MRAIRVAVDRVNSTLVVFLTSGATLTANSSSMDECITRINRITVQEAHSYGFPVLDRGEIERRLMYKSLQAENPPLISATHLQAPAQNIIATCLLAMLSCLNSTDKSSTSYDHLGFNFKSRPPPAPTILHNPP
jgi:hypothetical protein